MGKKKIIDYSVLRMRQAMTLEDKIRFSKKRIQEWVEYWGEDTVYVSFSGGKDSTVLLHLVRSMYPQVQGIFIDTGLEFPEIRKFVKETDNIMWRYPKMRFDEVLAKHGYPIVSKEVAETIEHVRANISQGRTETYRVQKLMGTAKGPDGKKSAFCQDKWKFLLDAPFKISSKCCNEMKKKPAHMLYTKFKRVPMVATLAEESRLRTTQYLTHGCNGFDNKIPTSTPLAFWTEQDILRYILEFDVPYCKEIYGDIVDLNEGLDIQPEYAVTKYKRTGCMFCAFGCHLEAKPNRFQRLAISHPKQYDYIMNKLGMREVLDYICVDTEV